MSKTMMTAQELNTHLNYQNDVYQAYFDGKTAGEEEEMVSNPHPQLESPIPDMPTAHEMWQDGYEEAKEVANMRRVVGICGTMMQSMRDFLGLMPGE